MSEPGSTNAIITAVIPYGDADSVVRLFTKERGRVGAFARRARASKKRFPGLSAPSLGNASLKERPHADLLELLELDVDPAVFGLAKDVRALAHASYVIELVERMLPEHEPAPEVFALVDTAVRAIAEQGTSAVLLRALELKLLQHTGYLPDLQETTELDDGAAREAAIALACAPDLSTLPDVDIDVLRAVARVFALHLRRQGGAPLKSVQFLASLEPRG